MYPRRWSVIFAALFALHCSCTSQTSFPLSVPQSVTKCEHPPIAIRVTNATPNANQILNHLSGTRVMTATIDCPQHLINVTARFASSALEDELLAINYGSQWQTIYKARGDSAGTAYLRVYGIDSDFIYFSISSLHFSDFLYNTVSDDHWQFDWRKGTVSKVR